MAALDQANKAHDEQRNGIGERIGEQILVDVAGKASVRLLSMWVRSNRWRVVRMMIVVIVVIAVVRAGAVVNDASEEHNGCELEAKAQRAHAWQNICIRPVNEQSDQTVA